jgi:cell division protein FtsN
VTFRRRKRKHLLGSNPAGTVTYGQYAKLIDRDLPFVRDPDSVAFKQELAEARQRVVETMEMLERDLKLARVARARAQELADSDRRKDQFAQQAGESDVARVQRAKPRVEFVVHAPTFVTVTVAVKADRALVLEAA